jgi:hypothetical protein
MHASSHPLPFQVHLPSTGASVPVLTLLQLYMPLARCVTDDGVNVACSTQAHLSLIYIRSNLTCLFFIPASTFYIQQSPFAAPLRARWFQPSQPLLIWRCNRALCHRK